MNHEAQVKAEQAIGRSVDWITPYQGQLKCPGIEQHGNRTGARDTFIYLDEVPTVHCLHQSCQATIAETNRALRSALGDYDPAPTLKMGNKVISRGSAPRTRLAPRDRSEFLKLKRRESLIAANARKKLEELINTADYAWDVDKIMESSPHGQPEDPREDWPLFLGLYEGLEGSLWVGDTRDSGQPHHAENFRSIDEWTATSEPVGNFTCPSLFAPGTISRSNRNVIQRPYLVVESDELSYDEMGAVIRWLERKAEWKLHCIVDSANKSLHGHFSMVPSAWFPELQVAFEAMKLDRALFKPSQPVRVPGIIRPDTGRWQRIIYYAPKPR